MKILVYGCGVIGSLLVHTLCKEIHETYDHGTKIPVCDPSTKRRNVASVLLLAGGLAAAVCIYKKRKK
ncbi:MAG: hypothetical protein K6C13_08740 [Oscillospiraceae bacterium]|nr:hypothetical protein [Oscillospiraceae bacterium]